MTGVALSLKRKSRSLLSALIVRGGLGDSEGWNDATRSSAMLTVGLKGGLLVPDPAPGDLA